VDSRFLPGFAQNLTFELFSPHMEDMDSSNNSSLVLKVTGLDPGGFSYLITGDTETQRWERISKIFGAALKSDMMAAPHHGSINGVHPATLLLVSPHTVLISAGVDNQYGHPDSAAVNAYRLVASQVFSTHAEGGHCLYSFRGSRGFETRLVRHVERAENGNH
jgi:beta-lactamase superfamily II metal-dependent hydrolase